MVDFNCECEDTSSYSTLLQLRTRMMVGLGFAAQKANPPPGMADLIDGWLTDAQQFLYQKNPSLRTERYFRWTMLEGEGYYGIRDDDTPSDLDPLTATGGTIALTAAALISGSSAAGLCTFEFSGSAQETGGTLLSGTLASYADVNVYWRGDVGGELQVDLRVPTDEARASPQTAYFTTLTIAGVTNGTINASGASIFNTTVDGDDTVFTWIWSSASLSGSMSAGNDYVAVFLPESAAYCGKHLNEYKISAVWLEDLNGRFTPLWQGIPASFYTTSDQLGFPSRYEIRSCIEVFPRPSADGLKLWIKGQMGLDAFTADSDRTTIDSNLVYLWALAAGKAHYDKPDFQRVQSQAAAYLMDVISGKHGTKRYIPRYEPPPPAVQPMMTVYNTGP